MNLMKASLWKFMEVMIKGHDVRAHDTRDGAGQTRARPVRARSAALSGINEKFAGYRDATQFSGIFPEIPGCLVGMRLTSRKL